MDEDDEQRCSICMDVTESKNVATTECGHKFHTSCLLRSFDANRACPLCRRSLLPVSEDTEADPASSIQSMQREYDAKTAVLLNSKPHLMSLFSTARQWRRQYCISKNKLIQAKRRAILKASRDEQVEALFESYTMTVRSCAEHNARYIDALTDELGYRPE